MRIAFSGAACTGKTTTIQHFLGKWSTYNFIKSEYRKIIKDKKHSKNTTSKPKSKEEAKVYNHEIGIYQQNY